MKLKLIENCKKRWWRLWSVQLATITATISAFIWSSPDVVISIITRVPWWLRMVLIFGYLGLRILARISQQKGHPLRGSSSRNRSS